MFKLVGKETIAIGSTNTKATVHIDAVSGFAYEYSLEVDGKSLQKFISNRAKTTLTWLLKVDGVDRRVVLGEACDCYTDRCCVMTAFTTQLLLLPQRRTPWTSGATDRRWTPR